MKTTSYLRPCNGNLSFAILLLLFIAFCTVSCEKAEPVELGPSADFSPVTDYVGRYLLEEDNCLSMAPQLQIGSDSPIQRVADYHSTNLVVYLTGFITTNSSPILAEWDGVAFNVNSQKIMMDGELTGFSARIYEYDSMLTINYHMSNGKVSSQCTATFVKTF